MVNQEILEGIKQAVTKGESLASAMQSFYNAGYPKDQIEESARAFQLEHYNMINQLNPNSVNYQKTPPTLQQNKNNQVVSNYNFPPPKRSKVGMAILLIILFLLLTGLFLAFIFRIELIYFLSNLFV